MAMTPEQFAAAMKKLFPALEDGRPFYNPDKAHEDADELICELLKSLGYGEGVAIFEDAIKWYS